MRQSPLHGSLATVPKGRRMTNRLAATTTSGGGGEHAHGSVSSRIGYRSDTPRGRFRTRCTTPPEVGSGRGVPYDACRSSSASDKPGCRRPPGGVAHGSRAPTVRTHPRREAMPRGSPDRSPRPRRRRARTRGTAERRCGGATPRDRQATYDRLGTFRRYGKSVTTTTTQGGRSWESEEPGNGCFLRLDRGCGSKARRPAPCLD
jgi:hypothetical protein